MKLFLMTLCTTIVVIEATAHQSQSISTLKANSAAANPLSSSQLSADDRFLTSSKTGKTAKSSKDGIHPCARRIADQLGWSNWYNSVETFAPVFRVRNDRELRKIIKLSRETDASDKTRCTVRPFGSTHTYDGLVMQRSETDVVLISLIDHTPDDPAWAPSVDPATGKVRLLAGQSWYDAVALYRHHGLVLPERTLGRFFSVGGVIANAVHGGSREGGFIHSRVTKMLVMTSNGKTSEIEGDELKYWRSSGGHLGVILAVEMQLVKEVEEGGTLAMKADLDDFGYVFTNPENPNIEEITMLVSLVTQKVYSIFATSDHNEFFFDYYANQLASYYTDFSGPPFDATLATQYEAAAQYNLQTYGHEVAYNGGSSIKVPEDLCSFLCVPGTGYPPTGDGSIPCDPARIPDTGDLVCQSPLATAAAFTQATMSNLKSSFEETAASVNDGYFGHFVSDHNYVAVIIPSRAFYLVFLTWWRAHSRAIQLSFDQSPGAEFQYIPNNALEFRFISPGETAIMNPIQPFSQVKADFDNNFFNSFDMFFPPVQGVPDGLISIEVINIKGVNDEDHPKYFNFLENVLHNLPSNPLAQYGPNPYTTYGQIVQECDAQSGIILCVSVNNDNNPPFANPTNNTLPCCIPPVPINVHIAKEYGFGIDPETTPTTGQPVPFKNRAIVDAVFSSPEKTKSIDQFNEKVAQYDAEVFAGGGLLRWLRPQESMGFEPRKLSGQVCGSTEYNTNPDAECISNQCDLLGNICL